MTEDNTLQEVSRESSEGESRKKIRWSAFLRDKRYSSRPISKVETAGSMLPPGVHPEVLQRHLGEAELQVYRALNQDVVLSEEQVHLNAEIEKLKDAILNRKPVPASAQSQGMRAISPGAFRVWGLGFLCLAVLRRGLGKYLKHPNGA